MFWVLRSCHFLFVLSSCVGNYNDFLSEKFRDFLENFFFSRVFYPRSWKSMQQSPQPTWPAPCRGSQLSGGPSSGSLSLGVELTSTRAHFPFLQVVILAYLRLSLLLLNPFPSDASTLPFSGPLNLLFLVMLFPCSLHCNLVVEHRGFGIKILIF